MYTTTSQIASRVLIKLAMRREMKEIAKGNLNDAQIGRVFENNRGMKRERLIKSLSHGATAHADVVMDPQHEIVARKRLVDPTKMTGAEIAKHKDIAIYDDIRRLQDQKGTRGGFARVHRVDPKSGLVFQEYIKGPSVREERIAKTPGLMKKFKKVMKLHAKQKKLNLQGLTTKANEIGRQMNAIDPSGLAFHQMHDAMKDVDDFEFTSDHKRFVKDLRKTNPGMWDHHAGQNMLRGKDGKLYVIDAAADRGNFGMTSLPDAKSGDEFRQFQERAKNDPNIRGSKKKRGYKPTKEETAKIRDAYRNNKTQSRIGFGTPTPRPTGGAFPATVGTEGKALRKGLLRRLLTPRNALLGLGAGAAGYGGYRAYQALRDRPPVHA